jgi:hypothetical protein
MDWYREALCPICGQHLMFCWDNWCLVCKCGHKIQLVKEEATKPKEDKDDGNL